MEVEIRVVVETSLAEVLEVTELVPFLPMLTRRHSLRVVNNMIEVFLAMFHLL